MQRTGTFLVTVIRAAAFCCIALYGSLLLFAFLWDVDEARELYGDFLQGNGVHWLVFLSFLLGFIAYRVDLHRAKPKVYPASSFPPVHMAPVRVKLGGVHGKANAAHDDEISKALAGKTGGFDAMFEE